MPTNPEEYINAKIPEIPHDGNHKWISPIMFPISNANGDIVGYAPPAVILQPDGTALLQSSLAVNAPIDIGNVNLLNSLDAIIDPATEQKQDDIISAITNIALPDPVGLKNIADATINPSTLELQQEISDRIGSLTTPAVGTTHELLERLDILLQSLETILGTTGTLTQILDGTGGGFKAAVDSSNRLVVSAITTAPPNTTAQSDDILITTMATVDSLFVIPNGETLTIQQLRAGSDEAVGSVTRVFLYEDPNGDLSVLNLIDILFVNGASDDDDLNEDFVGDGTRRILLRIEVPSGPARLVFGAWRGFTI